ncbi:unnamed protein product [Calicophoron daubneyi]|uniref:NADH dehydrogenase [ubiquinone] 1 alpha subcomplex subunit 13 n=1 Tax=Calicophoron daubneyi TaxID=300641 RepID=A0AAV2TNA5_CALDB
MPAYKQEMPPGGGYAPINVLGKAAKKPLNGILVLAGLYACTFLGLTYQSRLRKKLEERSRENEEVRLALAPFVVAERERLYMKQLRRNRDYETALMADVPGWKVGYWHDYPVFHNPRGLWVDPDVDEFYAHTTRRFRNSRVGASQDYF